MQLYMFLLLHTAPAGSSWHILPFNPVGLGVEDQTRMWSKCDLLVDSTLWHGGYRAAAEEAKKREKDAEQREENGQRQLRDTQGQLAQRRHADGAAASQSHIMQGLSHAAKTGIIVGKVWGRLGKALD